MKIFYNDRRDKTLGIIGLIAIALFVAMGIYGEHHPETKQQECTRMQREAYPYIVDCDS